MATRKPKPPVRKPAPAKRRAVRRPRGAGSPDLDSRSILLEAASKVGEVEVAQVVGRAREIEEKAARPELAAHREDILALLASLKAYSAGKDKKTPFGRIAAITGALSYLISPVDLIPDFIPQIGFSDDVAVIGACLRLIGRRKS